MDKDLLEKTAALLISIAVGISDAVPPKVFAKRLLNSSHDLPIAHVAPY